MAKVSRPAQGNNSNKKITKSAAGGSNERTLSGARNPNNKPRGYAS